MSDVKTLEGIEVKDAEKGEISAVIATFDVIDKDGDVVRESFFEEGEKVRLSQYNHASWGPAMLPVGRGEIRKTDERAEFHGHFFMDVPTARDTFNVVKQMGELQEYSWGFDILESEEGEFAEGEDDAKRDVRFLIKGKTHEVSPVLLGASIGTETLAVKGAIPGMKLSEHIVAMNDGLTIIEKRVLDVLEKRKEQDKSLGEESRLALEQLQSTCKRLCEVETTTAGNEEPEDTLGFDAELELEQELARTRR